MNRVLVLAYYFPPLGGAGVQRTVKLLKHLPDLGFAATVVTGPEAAGVDWAPADATLHGDLPEGTPVHRIRGPQPPPTAGWAGRFDRLLDRPEAFSRWWSASAAEVATSLAADADLVYASMSPFETAEAAARVARAAGLPWVADLRDPWALDEWTIYPTAFHRARDERRMRRLLATADAVILNTPEAEHVARRRFPELAGLLSVVPNGWDRDDLIVAPEPRHDDRFRIVYAGYSHVEAGLSHRRKRRLREALGGATRGLDVLARSHVVLVEAIERLTDDDPVLGGRIEVHLAGAAEPRVSSPRIVQRGYLAHEEAVALVRSADLLFLPMHDLPSGMRSLTVPGKTYEYLAAGRPILAALPDGDARDLLSGLPHVRLCRPLDVDCMVEALRALVPEPPAAGAVSVAAPFERHVLAEQVAAVFERVLSERRKAEAA